MDPKAAFRGRAVILTRRQLLDGGCTPIQLAAEVHSGGLVRIRRGHYALPGTDPDIVTAVRVGGRLACVSAARQLGIWVPPVAFAHVHLRHEASRLRAPGDRFELLNEHNRDGVTLHWWPLIDRRRADAHQVSVLDVLAQIIRCQPRPIAVAAIDSALNQGLVSDGDLDQLFAQIPKQHASLRGDIDGRSMSGLETIVRLIAKDAGLSWDLQCFFFGVGMVDMVVAECVVVESDGREFHENQQKRDYRRDALLAALGYTVVRFNYQLVMFHPDLVLRAIRAAVSNHRRGPQP